MGMKIEPATSGRGRPRAFDLEQALDRAVEVFWRQGYEGTSLTDLTEAMGINRPSLYAAFGNKEELYRKVLDRYAEGPACHVLQALQEPTARRVVERLLLGTIDLLSCPSNPKGCLGVHGALACGAESERLRQEHIARRTEAERSLCQRLERAQEEGDLASNAVPADLARYTSTICQGMSVQAASGASRSDLLKVAELALKNWPG